LHEILLFKKPLEAMSYTTPIFIRKVGGPNDVFFQNFDHREMQKHTKLVLFFFRNYRRRRH